MQALSLALFTAVTKARDCLRTSNVCQRLHTASGPKCQLQVYNNRGGTTYQHVVIAELRAANTNAGNSWVGPTFIHSFNAATNNKRWLHLAAASTMQQLAWPGNLLGCHTSGTEDNRVSPL